jgi:hypothetical protein
VARSNITEKLLAFASAEAEGQGYDGSVDRAEGRCILSSLARGSDPSVRIRAIEQLAKFDERETEQGRSTENDGFAEDRYVRTFLHDLPRGPSCNRVNLARDTARSGQSAAPSRCLQSDHAGRSRLLVNNTLPPGRHHLKERLANPNWQLEARVKLWREVGIDAPPGPDLGS